jgi:integrase
MARRGENIRKRKDGRWEGRFISGYDEKGKALYRSVYAFTYNDCRSKLQAEKSLYQRSVISHGSYTVNSNLAEIIRDWLESIKISSKYSTYVKYRNTAENHILPELGGIRLKALSNNLLNGFLQRKSNTGRLNGKGGLSASSVRMLYVILTSALSFASEYGLPAGIVFNFKPPHKTDPELFILSENEQTRLEKILLTDIDNSKLGILLCLYTGMRLGEVCSLHWDDIDLERNVIKVRNTVQRVQMFDENTKAKTKLMIGAPKSKSSVRDIPIPFCISKLLTGFFAHPQNGYVVTGSPLLLDPRTYQYRFKNYLKNAGVDDIHFHALRATFATNCIVAGIDAKTVSSFLGHGSVIITLNKYVCVGQEMKQTQINKLSNIRGQDWGMEQSISA